MKRHAADQNDAVVFEQRTVQFDRNAAARFADTRDLHQVARVVVEGLYSLRDERREDRAFFFFGNFSMNAGREDDRHPVRLDTVGDQAANQKVNDLPRPGLPRCIGHDEQNGLVGTDQLFKPRRIDRLIETRADLNIGQRKFVFLRFQNVKLPFVVFEWNRCAAVTQADRGHTQV